MSDLSATGCGCDTDCGCDNRYGNAPGFGGNNCLWIIILLCCCGGCGGKGGFGGGFGETALPFLPD